MKEDRGLTAIQAFLRAKAREFQHLFCSVCRIEPPKYAGGPCDSCERELGLGG